MPCTVSSRNFPPSVVNLFSWLVKLTSTEGIYAKRNAGVDPGLLSLDTPLFNVSVIFSGGRHCGRRTFLGLCWALTLFCPFCHSLVSVFPFLHSLSHLLHHPSILNLICLLLPLQITHMLFSSFSLPKPSSFRSSQQCPSCYHVHLLLLSRIFLSLFPLVSYGCYFL